MTKSVTNLLSFEEAIASAAEGKKKHVLLGNGFSRAYRNDIFAYDALFKRADFTNLPNAQIAFNALGTTDFELVMRALRMAADAFGISTESVLMAECRSLERNIGLRSLTQTEREIRKTREDCGATGGNVW